MIWTGYAPERHVSRLLPPNSEHLERSMKYGDERRALVMRVPPPAAAEFAELVQTKERGARSAMLVTLVEAELERFGLNLTDRQFDAPPRRGRR